MGDPHWAWLHRKPITAPQQEGGAVMARKNATPYPLINHPVKVEGGWGTHYSKDHDERSLRIRIEDPASHTPIAELDIPSALVLDLLSNTTRYSPDELAKLTIYSGTRIGKVRQMATVYAAMPGWGQTALDSVVVAVQAQCDDDHHGWYVDTYSQTWNGHHMVGGVYDLAILRYVEPNTPYNTPDLGDGFSYERKAPPTTKRSRNKLTPPASNIRTKAEPAQRALPPATSPPAVTIEVTP